MKTWLEPKQVGVPAEFQAAVGGHPLVSEVLLRRGFGDLDRARAFLDSGLYVPTSPYDLDDMQIAVDRLQVALDLGQRICVWGDFDVDGQTATTLLVASLEELGGRVTYHIPVRSKESHGINLPVLRQVIEGGIDLLLTCDTGISEHESVAYARDQGVEVIITDHHDLPPELPQALVVINPKRGPADHPLHNLPGVGVAYKLAQALFERMGNANGAEKHLDLVALGIVADLAVQVGDVRYLLQRGLEQLRHPHRLGLQMMMERAEIDPSGLTEEHIGFELAPRMNALGRLGDANQAVEFLTTSDKGRARNIANQLEGLNAERRMKTSQVFQAAQAQIEGEPARLQDAALVLSHPSWPGGVIGIVASRLVERYSRPVLLIAAPPGELARGSARSVPGVNISAAIAAQQDLLVSFGGHPMAAGFALEEEHIPEFRRALSQTVGEMISRAQFEPSLEIDGYLPLANLSLELVLDLERLAPFGPGNPDLSLVGKDLRYVRHKELGRTGEHLLVTLKNVIGEEYKIVWWGGGIEQLPEWITSGAALDLAYSVRSRDFRGEKELQIQWLEAHPVDSDALEVKPERQEIEVHDHRGISYPLGVLKQLISSQKDLPVWAEAGARDRLLEQDIQSQDRFSLAENTSLVIWTTPPGGRELREVLERVSPDIVHLFDVDPQMDKLEPFIKRLLGLVKYALGSSQGMVHISILAAATAQREATVRAGIDWLAARGILKVLDERNGEILLAEGEQVEGDDLARKLIILQELLSESAAYRTHFSRAEADQLILSATDK